MKEISIVMNIIPIVLLLYYLATEIKRVANSKNDKVVLYSGGFHVRPVLNLVYLACVLLVVIVIVIHFFNYYNDYNQECLHQFGRFIYCRQML